MTIGHPSVAACAHIVDGFPGTISSSWYQYTPVFSGSNFLNKAQKNRDSADLQGCIFPEDP